MALLLLLLLFVSSASSSAIPKVAETLRGDDLIAFVNMKQMLFKAEKSKFTEEEKMARVMKGEFARDKMRAPEAEEIQMDDSDIPANFDSREKWGQCNSIKAIYDQSNCGSCWTFCTAETMSDRTCIATSQQIVFSSADILSCCPNCGYGCNGGWPTQAFNYWVQSGVVTGGPYDSQGDCMPYPFHPCGQHAGEKYYGDCPNSFRTPSCKKSCQDGYNVTYPSDKHSGGSSYSLKNDVAAIQKEIMTNGPVASTFDVYTDFFDYKTGIYVQTAGSYAGGHCVKTIGWGVENGTPYWLVANSWNTDWGENGFFRILRGTNECNFEAGMSAALPKA